MKAGYQSLLALILLAAMFSATSLAATYRTEPLKEPAPKEGIGADIVKLLAPTGVRVLRGESRVVCDIWLCKEWSFPSFKTEGDVLYPFRPGQLVGVVHFPRKGGDFRDQAIDKGTYTLRYAHQPQDGDHAGTSPTRDFLLLVIAEDDSSPKHVAYEQLNELSAEAVGTSHPGMFAMKKVSGDTKAPSIRHDEENDWWIVRLQSSAKAAGQTKQLAFDVVIVGCAEE